MITDSEAPPPTGAEKNEGEAAAVTATVQANLDRARAAIDEAEKINALGVFVDRAATLAQIGAARRALNDAFCLLTLAKCWPEQRTYEATEK